MSMFLHAHIRADIHTYMIIHACIRTYVRTYIRAYVHTYIHTYIHTYMRAYRRTYIHTCLLTCRLFHKRTHVCMRMYTYYCGVIRACRTERTHESVRSRMLKSMRKWMPISPFIGFESKPVLKLIRLLDLQNGKSKPDG